MVPSKSINASNSVDIWAKVLCSVPTNRLLDFSPLWIRDYHILAPSTHTETKPSMTLAVLQVKKGWGLCQTGVTVVPRLQQSRGRRCLITEASCPAWWSCYECEQQQILVYDTTPGATVVLCNLPALTERIMRSHLGNQFNHKSYKVPAHKFVFISSCIKSWMLRRTD